MLSRLHRWLGTGFALLFVLWFGSGFVMMYVPFPSLSEPERITALAPLDLAAVKVAPSAAVAGLQAERLQLVDVLGRPRYLVTRPDGTVTPVGADDGRTPPLLERDAALRIARRFLDRPVHTLDGPFEHDQWVVHHRFDAARPFYRAAAGDAAGTEVYVSARLGYVVQRTTRFERGWNLVGAVVHWIYPTPLRKHHSAWDLVVWSLALGGLVVAASGYLLGCIRMLNAWRRTGAMVLPYRGWLRWHHVLGLTGGLFAVTWVFSGWLSMDHGRLFSLDQPDRARIARFQGADMATAFAGLAPERMRTLVNAREMEFVAVAGQGFIVLRGVPEGAGRLVPLLAGVPQPPLAAIPDALFVKAASAAWAPARVLGISGIAPDDAYAHTRSDPLPAGTCRIRLADAGATWIHVDPASGRIVSLMDGSRRTYRWLYTGLHTFDFPLLRDAGLLWRVLMWAALLAGTGLSVSALVLGKRRIGRSMRGSQYRRRE